MPTDGIVYCFLASLYNPIEFAILVCEVEDSPLRLGGHVILPLTLDAVLDGATANSRLALLGGGLKMTQLYYTNVTLTKVLVTSELDITELIHATTVNHESELNLIQKLADKKKMVGRQILRKHAARRSNRAPRAPREPHPPHTSLGP